MKRIGYVCTTLLLAVAVSGLAGCQANSSGVEAKLDDINTRLERIEGLVKQGGGAAGRPTPQRPPGPDPAKVYAVPVEGSPAKGSPNAKVTVVEAFEFACPFCERARPTMAEILKTYGDDVRIVYKHFIVHQDDAVAPARAVCAAHLQGKFTAMKDAIWDHAFNAGRDLSEESMKRQARRVGLNMRRFEKDMSGPCAQRVEKDHALLSKVGVQGTPYFYVNGRLVRGAMPFDVFQQLIDEELAKANEVIQSQGVKAADYYDTVIVAKGRTEM